MTGDNLETNKYSHKSLLALISLYTNIKNAGGDPGERLAIASAMTAKRIESGASLDDASQMLSDEMVLASAQEIDYVSFVDASIFLASLFFQMSRYDDAGSIAKSAIECLDSCISEERDLIMYSQLTSIIADASTCQGNQSTAKNAYERFLGTARKLTQFIPDPRVFVKPLIFLAQYHFACGEIGSANARLKECETHIDQISRGDSISANMLFFRGTKALLTCTHLDQDRAIRYVDESLKFYRDTTWTLDEVDLEDFIGAVTGLHCLAVSLECLDRYQDAAALFHDEIPLVVKSRMNPPGSSLAALFLDLGFTGLMASDDEDGEWTIESARDAFESANAFCIRTGRIDSPEYADSCFFLGLTHLYDEERLSEGVSMLKLSEMLDRAREGDSLLKATQDAGMLIAYSSIGKQKPKPEQIIIESAILEEYSHAGGDASVMIRRLDALEMVSRDLITALGEQEAPPETDNEVVEDDFLLADFKTPNTIIPDEADDLFFNLPGSILIDDECFDDLLKDLSLTYDTAAFVHNRGGVLYNRAVMALQGKDYQAASDFAHKAAEVLEHIPDMVTWAIESHLVVAEAQANMQAFESAGSAVARADQLSHTLPDFVRLAGTEKRILRVRKLIARLSKKTGKSS